MKGRTAALAALAVLLAAAAYAPILRNGYFTDDFVQLYRSRTAPLAEFLLTPYGGHILFAQNAILVGIQTVAGAPAPPRLLFAAMLVLHLTVVLSLFHLVRRWTMSAPLACAVAAWWGTLPVLNGTLGWYSVLGQVVVTLCVLAILASASTDRPWNRMRRALWVAAALLSALSFGGGDGNRAPDRPLVSGAGPAPR
ncbi:MAG: hypothetical protein SF182_18290 [Deltaproteobacteria bacterium]|nr:hypothetical protein [Deltaproteobacteria bacterium]